HFSRLYGKFVSGLTARAEIVLSRHTWPGNVRELENVIGHACMMAESRIDVADLPDYLLGQDKNAGTIEPEPGTEALASLEVQERKLICEALAQSNGNQSQAARILKIGRDALRYKMKKFGLEPPSGLSVGEER
ncbi:MAG: helix-turn-helix domain-containing protein, partial [Bryobacteraceae bacterium]